ncbi:MAG: diaminopimelate decarboxylase, partial [Candidatus Marinamargulisbacteria bacterium]
KSIINLVASEGLGLDVSSGGELYTALQCSVDPDKIIFHGNNKAIDELELALKNNVRIVLDNEKELENIATLTEKGYKARIMIRLKPEIEAHTHKYIKTGHIESKFGIGKELLLSVVKAVDEHPSMSFLGLHAHIGSQILDVDPFYDLVGIMVDHMVSVKKELGIDVAELNLGGGMGIKYMAADDPPSIREVITAQALSVKSKCEENGLLLPKLYFEPGRSIVGNAGVTLYSIGAVKKVSENRTYLFIDGGMADNLRPLLYQSQYTMEVANKSTNNTAKTYTIAGKFCESGDILAEDVSLAESEAGDLLVVFGTGAYNYAMASNYNRYRRPAMVLVSKGRDILMVRRETYEDLVRFDET